MTRTYIVALWAIFAAFVAFVAVFTIMVVIPDLQRAQQCQAEGGNYVKTWSGYVCDRRVIAP